MSASAEPALPEPSSAIEGIRRLRAFLNERIVGQEALNLRLLVALLADGHLLVEGAPGLAKTTAIRTLSAALEGSFHRIQFTPDLLPADLTGTEIFHPQDGGFHFERGPLFHNLLLADEINRAPAKVQSALLEAMAERQVTVGRATYPLPGLFLVMATQNPIEQEGTYPLPEAQLDRFLMYIRVGYPSLAAEHRILAIAREQAHAQLEASSANRIEPGLSAPLRISQGDLFRARREVLGLHLAPALEDYLLQLVAATRHPAPYGAELARWVRFGASPRASIALDRCARAHAWLHDRDYVSPEDIQSVAHDVLRHRVLLSFEAEADGVTPDTFIDRLLQRVAVP